MLSSTKTAEQLTLGEAVELIVYDASCNRCHETRRVDLAQLCERLGPRILVGDIRPRLRCSKCGSRNIIVVTLWRSASSTPSLMAHWSEEGSKRCYLSRIVRCAARLLSSFAALRSSLLNTRLRAGASHYPARQQSGSSRDRSVPSSRQLTLGGGLVPGHFAPGAVIKSVGLKIRKYTSAMIALRGALAVVAHAQ